MFNAAQHAMQLRTQIERKRERDSSRERDGTHTQKPCESKTCDKSAEKQRRKTFSTLMKNVLCGLKPICAKAKAKISERNREKERKLNRKRWETNLQNDKLKLQLKFVCLSLSLSLFSPLRGLGANACRIMRTVLSLSLCRLS